MCGVIGLYFAHPDFKKSIVTSVLSGLLANQHRGEESAGFCVANGQKISGPFRKMGLIRNLFLAYQDLDYSFKKEFTGFIAIAHNRYSTTGSSSLKNAAPFIFEDPRLGSLAIVHNGNITNTEILRKKLKDKGIEFTSTTDSEVIGALIVDAPGRGWEEKIVN